MDGRLNDILPEPIGAETEGAIQELVKRKMTLAAHLAVEMLHKMEERFGEDARDVVSEMISNRKSDPQPQGSGDPEKDLHDFCNRVERGCAGTHRWQRIIDEPARIGYAFNRCMWNEVFQELGEPELGLYYCASDEPSVKAYNQKLGLERTKILMKGDEICDHVFFVEKESTK